MFKCLSFDDKKANVWYEVNCNAGYVSDCSCPDVAKICKHMFLISRIKKIPFTYVKKNNTYAEDKKSITNEEDLTYDELLNEEHKIRYEELCETQNNMKKLLLKELDMPLKIQDNNYADKNKELELLLHNMKGFISTLQNARTPHQARPSRQI